MGQAPERSIRCPLCGGYFERDIALFSVGGRTQTLQVAGEADEQVNGFASPFHGINCYCCPPRRQ